METVGIRQLKENLSRYLRQVRKGEPLIITDRKKRIAVIQPISAAGDLPERQLVDLVRENKVRWSGEKPKGIHPPLDVKGSPVSDAVVEDRR